MLPHRVPPDQVGDILTDNNQVTFSDVDFGLDLDHFCDPDMLNTGLNTLSPSGSMSGDLNIVECAHTGVSDTNSSRSPKVTELLENFGQPGVRDSFPQISDLAKIIGILEELIQNRETTIDEVLRANKFCMTVINGIMSSDFFGKCKSCEMLILTAMDLVITLYETGVSEDMRGSSQACRAQSADQTFAQKASLQFGVFQLEPEDHIMLRNQIVRNELQRCIQMIRGQSSEYRNASRDGSTPSHKIRQHWFDVIENRARTLTSSLHEKSTDIPM